MLETLYSAADLDYSVIISRSGGSAYTSVVELPDSFSYEVKSNMNFTDVYIWKDIKAILYL